MDEKQWHADVLTFWFEELTPEQWFSSSQELDDQIKQRFKSLVIMLGENLPEIVLNNPNACLAAIICFDQFTRNIFRGMPEAFQYDLKALQLALLSVEKGWDMKMTDQEKQFSYMPFMHAEDMNMQEKSLKLIGAINERALQAAQDHYNIIAEFGRYPHRNEVLGRQSTEAELKYLEDAQRFGQ